MERRHSFHPVSDWARVLPPLTRALSATSAGCGGIGPAVQTRLPDHARATAGVFLAATRAKLAALGQVETVLGQHVLVVAEQVEDDRNTASVVVALSRSTPG